MYNSRIISVAQHLELNKSHNTSLQFVAQQEENDIVRLKKKFLGNYEIVWKENKELLEVSKQASR